LQLEITILIEKPFLWLLFYLLLSDNNEKIYLKNRDDLCKQIANNQLNRRYFEEKLFDTLVIATITGLLQETDNQK
jgi:hypothetical protein